jgi:hypothetical protein
MVSTYLWGRGPPRDGFHRCLWNRPALCPGGAGPEVAPSDRYAPRTVLRPPRRSVAPPVERRRSNAAAPVAIAVVLVGLVLGTYSVIVPVLLGLTLLGAALSFLSTRVNPLSVGFYLPVKPSFAAIGVVALGGVVLFLAAWMYWTHGIASVIPGTGAPRL